MLDVLIIVLNIQTPCQSINPQPSRSNEAIMPKIRPNPSCLSCTSKWLFIYIDAKWALVNGRKWFLSSLKCEVGSHDLPRERHESRVKSDREKQVAHGHSRHG